MSGGLFGDCPTYLDPEAWSAYCEWRDQMPKHKRWSKYARSLILIELSKLHAAGEDASECLKQSIRESWTGVYAVRKPKPAPFTALPANDRSVTVPSSEAEKTLAYLARQDIDPEEVRAAARRAREKLARRA
jgi:hypothetical protein